MNVTREVILDLFPVYLSGEASPATRVLVEGFLKQDTDLAQRLKLQMAENFAAAVPSSAPPASQAFARARAARPIRRRRRASSTSSRPPRSSCREATSA